MAVDLADFTDVLRREIVPPGSTTFATVTDETLVGHLADAFWEAFLDGFFPDWTADEDGVVTSIVGGADITRGGVALIVLYAGLKILRNKILETQTKFRAKAGPVEFETGNSANLLVDMLAQLSKVKDRLLAQEDNLTPTILIDGYSIRQMSIGSYAGYVGTLFSGDFGDTQLLIGN